MNKDYFLKTHKPLSDKLAIYFWIWEDGDPVPRMELAKKLGFTTITVPLIINLTKDGKAVSWEEETSHIDFYNNCVRAANSLGLNVVTVINAETFNITDEVTKCMYTEDQIKFIKKSIKYAIKGNRDIPVCYVGWNEPNGIYWRNDWCRVNPDGTFNPGMETAVNGWINMDKYIIDCSKKYNINNINAPLSFSLPLNSHIFNYLPTVEYAEKQGLFKDADAINEHPYLYVNEFPSQEEMLFCDDVPVDLPKMSNEFGFEKWSLDEFGKNVIDSPSDAFKKTIREILVLDYLNYCSIGFFSMNLYAFSLLETNQESFNSFGVAVQNFMQEINGYTLDHWINVPTKDNFTNVQYVAVYKRKNLPTKILYWMCYNSKKTGDYVIDGQQVHLTFTDNVKIKTLN